MYFYASLSVECTKAGFPTCVGNMGGLLKIWWGGLNQYMEEYEGA